MNNAEPLKAKIIGVSGNNETIFLWVAPDTIYRQSFPHKVRVVRKSKTIAMVELNGKCKLNPSRDDLLIFTASRAVAAGAGNDVDALLRLKRHHKAILEEI
jgi:hypothetical protein